MTDTAPHTTFTTWKYCHYFDFVRTKDLKNIVVCCKLGVGKKKELSTANVENAK